MRLKRFACNASSRSMARSEQTSHIQLGSWMSSASRKLVNTSAWYMIQRADLQCTVLQLKRGQGNMCMVTGGANLGRVGVITNRERHPGSFDVVHVKDANGNSFATRLSNIFVIGKGNKAWISLPRGKGIHLTIAEERDKRLAAKQSSG
uniref:Ribosomal protein S4 X-linked n=1 Tax=Leptobrachium leishanense TaxID=445787 RepID=A0A8C5LNL3_9ANUR